MGKVSVSMGKVSVSMGKISASFKYYIGNKAYPNE